MKKLLVAGLIAALCLSTLAFVAGCGGDKNKDEAKSYMKKGDEYIDAVETTWEGLEEKQTEIATKAIGGDYSAFTGEMGEALKKEFEETFAAIGKNIDAAYAEYKKINGLEGVQDYKDYAAKMMEAIELMKKQLAAAQTLLAKLSDTLIALAQGQQVDLISMMMESEEMTMLQELGDDIDKLMKEAEQIKLDKKLES
ncbi:MAG: hypothetical protein H5T74_02235 [Actinobacteria bacterium]|nr:hypothetical protein [Actinomycetota bacterium]MDI6831307.1 hypothetical protein [Actinomycetota bacterium]